ncbi:caspase family protein [Actinoplanes sp. L3-i22]|uniref:caspase family protein n=1 Tax=Actinoplanes sp. L3-i22 TaxID=2836373 RepID=UPI001C76C6A6|nr:caspase family protein [Actinoplanes sp. L3-i22]BCY15491.1 hypothetical protein L3i22_105790 [Actinoplanes sp. L3-i22]
MTVFALLAGIDAYAAKDVPDLRGCRNDVVAAAAFLASRSTAARVLRLHDAAATRAAVIDGLHRHLGQAGPGDTALFWFSGHGSQVRVPPGLAHLETGPMMQTLVCADSRTPGVPDLLDKELSLLLDAIAGRGAHVVVVLDSCHSAGASRRTVRVRSVRPSLRVADRPPVLLPELGGRPYAEVGRADVRHVALAAARRTELAQELELDGAPRGVFSWALLRALGRLGGSATYRRLLVAARVDVEARVAGQVPQLDPELPGLADQPFLGGATAAPGAGMLLRHGRDGWELDAGACHGLPVGDDELRVAVVDAGRPREARVTRVLTERSLVTPLGWAPDPERQYPVVFSRVPPPRTTVTGLPAEEIQRSAFVRPAAPDEEPELRVVGGARIVSPEGEVPAGPGTVPQRLEHVARWRQIRALANPLSRLAGAVALELRPGDPDAEPIEPEGGVIHLASDQVYIRMYNRTDRPLYCVLLNLTSRYRVHAGLFPGAFLDARSTGWALGRKPVRITRSAAEPGRRSWWRPAPTVEPLRDWLKLLVAEEQFGSAPFELPGIDAAGDPRRGPIRLRGPHFRADAEPACDWTTVTVPMVTELPQ